jgi:hypothetical protein
VNTEIEKPKNSFGKRLLKFFFWFVLICLFIFSIILILVFVYKDDIKNAIIKELNSHLKTEVKVKPENIDITFLSTFPHCSLKFNDVLVYEPGESKAKDTLLFAKQINLFFNAKDIWNENYSIHKILIDESKCIIKFFKNNKTNFEIWKQDTAQTSGKSVNFALENITWNNCQLTYINQPKKMRASVFLNQLIFKGEFGEKKYLLESDVDFKLISLSVNKRNLLKNKNCKGDFNLEVNSKEYQLKKANLSMNKVILGVEGYFFYNDSLYNTEITYNAQNLDIESILSLLPEAQKRNISDYSSKGEFYLKGKLAYQNHKNFEIKTDFGVKNAAVTYQPNQITLTQLNLNGSLLYSNIKSELTFNQFSALLANDSISGNLLIKDFSKPFLNTRIRSNLNLQNFIKFWPIDTITDLSGFLKIDGHVKGEVEQIKNNFAGNTVELELASIMKNVVVKFKNSKHATNIISCDLKAKSRAIQVTNLELKKGSSDLSITGEIPNFFNYLIENNSTLNINGTLYSNQLFLADFVEENESSTGTSSNTLAFIPARLNFKLDARIKQFNYQKFEASDISGELEIKNQKAILSDFKMIAFQGEMEGDLFIDNSKNNLQTVAVGFFRSVNIQSMFTQFENFGQTTLLDKNIKGYATATVSFKANWDNQFNVDENSIVAHTDLFIVRGELIDFKPLESLSNYVDVKELKRIKFSSLETTVDIGSKVISLPKTQLNNSALNLLVSGKHTFNNEIDYHIQLKISELLAKKRKQDNEFGPVENDKENRRSAFLLMTGTVDNPIIKYDRQGLKEKLKQDLKDEKQNLKTILHEEFKLFKKDTVKTNSQKSKQTFELEKPKQNSNKQPAQKNNETEDDDF